MRDIYGIDLGTTNSLIGLRDEYLSDLVPSVVDLETKKAGESVKDDVNASRSFKVDMSMAIEGQTSIVSSRYVLEELRRQAGGSRVKDVVISVPAYFKDSQRQATQKAAELAGLNVLALINEPTAAAMYISRTRKQLSVVYDLGGGTFDVSIIDSRFGNYDVQSTDGIIVGGDDFDLMIFRNICKESGIKLHHMSKAETMSLKLFCTKLKIRMQKERKDITVDLSAYGGPSDFVFKEQTYIALMKMTFSETITKTRNVIGEAIPYGEAYDIVLVGGSTRCPYLREWLTKELGQAPVELFYDPDRVVAQGAALYADLIAKGEEDIMVSDVTCALSIGTSDGTVRNVIPKNSKVPYTNSIMIFNDRESDKIRVDVYQGDSILASQNEKIGTVVYDFGEIRQQYEGSVEITMAVDKSGIITFTCQELLKEPLVVVLERDVRNTEG